MIKQMRLTNRQKKGDVQHLLARSFSRREIITVPSSPPQDLTFAVPQFKYSLSPGENEKKADQVSLDELSIEPRMIGPSDAFSGDSPTRGITTTTADVIIEQSSLQPIVSSRHSSPVEEATKKERKDSLSGSDTDSEKSAHTPLLETKTSSGGGVAPTTLPTNSAPGIQKYDEMFASKRTEDEIPLGGSAENLHNQP